MCTIPLPACWPVIIFRGKRMEMSIGEKGFSLVLTIMQWASSLARPLALSMLLCAYQISSSLPVEGARAVGGEVGASCRLLEVGRPVRRRKAATMLYAN